MIVPFNAIVADTGTGGSAEFFDHTRLCVPESLRGRAEVDITPDIRSCLPVDLQLVSLIHSVMCRRAKQPGTPRSFEGYV
jgi:hypothetical protein